MQNEYNWNATFNRKFEAKLKGQSQSVYMHAKSAQSVNDDINTCDILPPDTRVWGKIWL
jgi:hypothetical protein